MIISGDRNTDLGLSRQSALEEVDRRHDRLEAPGFSYQVPPRDALQRLLMEAAVKTAPGTDPDDFQQSFWSASSFIGSNYSVTPLESWYKTKNLLESDVGSASIMIKC
jgi:hypothetical protein